MRQVTFGDYKGQADTPAGSLTRGWSVVPPPDTGSGGGDVLKALLGTDAVVCAAGVGQIPGRSSALEQAAIVRDYGTILDSAVQGLHAVGLNDGKPQVSVQWGYFICAVFSFFEGRGGPMLLLFMGVSPPVRVMVYR